MEHVLQWLGDNWMLVGGILYGAASDIIAASPLKENGVVQFIGGVLGKIFKTK